MWLTVNIWPFGLSHAVFLHDTSCCASSTCFSLSPSSLFRLCSLSICPFFSTSPSHLVLLVPSTHLLAHCNAPAQYPNLNLYMQPSQSYLFEMKICFFHAFYSYGLLHYTQRRDCQTVQQEQFSFGCLLWYTNK